MAAVRRAPEPATTGTLGSSSTGRLASASSDVPAASSGLQSLARAPRGFEGTWTVEPMKGPVNARLVTQASAHCRSASDQGHAELVLCSCSCQVRHCSACAVMRSRRPVLRSRSRLGRSHRHGRSTTSGRASMYICACSSCALTGILAARGAALPQAARGGP